MTQNIGSIPIGSSVKDPSTDYYWIVIEQGSGYTTLIKETISNKVQYSSTNMGFYPNSDLDVYLETTFYNTLSADLKGKVLYTSVPSHSSDTVPVTLTRRIYALSLSEIVSASGFEGDLIQYFNSDSRRGVGNPYWTRSSVVNDTVSAYIVGTTGNTLSAGKYSQDIYARPTMRINPNTQVSGGTSTVYNMVFNIAPTISGSDINVGQKTDPFTYNYTVNDDNSADSLTITEKANGVTIRTITNAVRGQTYTADLSSVWKQMPVNTSTTLTITVSDGSLSTTRTITFTRKEDRVVAYFKQSSLTPESVQPEQVLIRVIRTIATNADFKVFVCNNGLDSSPTWEDATSAVLAGNAYTFTNRMKTSENYAVNVKIQVLKNTANAYSYIKALGFSYI